MTSPSLAPASQALNAITGELLAVSAMLAGTMVGMAIAERHGADQAMLVSLMVQPDLRHRGIATRMTAELQRFLAEQGVCAVSAHYPSGTTTANTFEPLLTRLGWTLQISAAAAGGARTAHIAL